MNIARWKLLAALGGAAAAWPLAVRAQQPPMPVIGFLNAASHEPYARMLAAFHQGLNETGYVDGRSVAIEYRWAEGQYDRLPAMAAELVERQVAVIAATGTPAMLAAKAATTAIPIVFTTGTDPMQLGIIASLNRPGGNVTGVTTLNEEVNPKRLELARELVPAVTIMAVLVNPNLPAADSQARDLQAAARKLGLELHVMHASTERDLDAVFAKMVDLRVGALAITADAFFLSRRERTMALAARHSLPATSPWREAAMAGGLMSYGSSDTEGYQHLGNYAGRILKGEKPADMPVEQSTKFELIINLKAAKALGIEVPLSMLIRVNEVVE